MTDTTPPAVWVDGDPLMEAIASAVWERCDTSGGNSIVTDDPRNIAAVAASVARARAAVPSAPADRAAEWRAAADHLESLDPIEAALAGQHAWRDAAAELRRMADEARAPETGEPAQRNIQCADAFWLRQPHAAHDWQQRPDAQPVRCQGSVEAQQPSSTAPLAANLPLVKGRCPACNGASLFLGDGGYVTCSRIDCPEPDAASTALEQPAVGAQQAECAASISGRCLAEAQSETACDTEAGECVHGGRTTDGAQQPETEPCGAWGGCTLARGHNIGQADIPENHRPSAVGAQQPETQDDGDVFELPGPDVVAYRNSQRPSVLLCRDHGDGWWGLTPLTSDDLPDGGTCTYGDPADPDDVCGRDVLIVEARQADTAGEQQ